MEHSIKQHPDDPKTLIIKGAMASYPHLFTPRAGPDGGDPKYSCTLVFDRDSFSQDDLVAVSKAVRLAGTEKHGEDFLAKVKSGSLRSGIRTDGEDKGYPDGIFIVAKSQEDYPPTVLDEYAGEDGRPRVLEEPKKIYAGCRVNAVVRAYGYANVGKGVSWNLNGIQFAGHGERLDGRVDAADIFDAKKPTGIEEMVKPDTSDDDEDGGNFDSDELGSLLG